MRDQRKQFYNDARLQGTLISALIAIEVLLVAALLVYLYVEFNRVIDDRLYRIHGAGDAASWPAFVVLLAQAAGGFLLANALALYLAHLAWDRYVRRTVDLFARGLDAIAALDFAAGFESSARQHRIIDLLDTWRVRERRRNLEIARLVERLAVIGEDPVDEETLAELRRVVEAYRRLLP